MQLDTFEVIGGQPLRGELIPQGAKNEALQIVSAVLLTDDYVTISSSGVEPVNDLPPFLEALHSGAWPNRRLFLAGYDRRRQR